MRHVFIEQAGGPEVLQLRDTDTPTAGPGEVLIRVSAAGINRADIVQRQGFYPPPPGAPETPGLEVAGVVDSLGEGVREWQVGDRVCALLAGGGYAEYAVARAAECLPIPDGVSMEEAAGLTETILTVWSNVVHRARLQPGESFLVHGGSSGIGTTAIQLIGLYGCPVYTTVGNHEKADFCRELGATRVVNYREEDFVEALQKECPGGVDVILDMVGGSYVERNMQLAAREGRIVNIAYQQGFQAEVNFAPLMLKRLTLTGSTLRAREPEFKAELASDVRKRVWPWVESGELRAIVHKVYDFSDVAEAHRTMEASTHIGKLILSWEAGA